MVRLPGAQVYDLGPRVVGGQYLLRRLTALRPASRSPLAEADPVPVPRSPEQEAARLPAPVCLRRQREGGALQPLRAGDTGAEQPPDGIAPHLEAAPGGDDLQPLDP